LAKGYWLRAPLNLTGSACVNRDGTGYAVSPSPLRASAAIGLSSGRICGVTPNDAESIPMKTTLAITATSLLLISSQARADEHRPGDAALVALSGAVVLGPIGAVAGAVVGYTAGPSIAHSWGFRHSHSATHRTKAARQAAPPTEAPAQAPEARAQPMPPSEAHASMPAPQAPPVPKTASTALPPVQTLE
jgi:hypothetical protein